MAKAGGLAFWKSLPEDLQLRIVDLLPALGDVARLGRVSRGCADLVEGAMRGRCAAAMRSGRRRIGGGGGDAAEAEEDDVDEEEEEEGERELALPPGARSWVRVVASRSGLLPPDGGLRMDGPAEFSGSGGGAGVGVGEYVVASGVGGGGGEGGDEIHSFEDLDVPEDLLRGIREYGLERPSALQRRALRPLVAARDALILGSPGTGKTTAYVIGLLRNVDPSVRRCQAVVLLPAREAAAAIEGSMVRGIGAHLGVRTLAVGGTSAARDASALRDGGVQMVFGTPERVCELVRGRALVLRRVRHLVLDAADDLLWGFRDRIYDIYRALPLTVRVGVVATSLTDELLRLASNVLPRDPARVRSVRLEPTLYGVRQYYLDVGREDWKLDALCDLLDSLPDRRAIVYVGTRRKAAWLVESMRGRGLRCSAMPGDADGGGRVVREGVIRGFEGGKQRVLVVEDVFAPHLYSWAQEVASLVVVNFDVPTNCKNYIFQVGGKGRTGPVRKAVTFVTPGDIGFLRDIEAFYSTAIKELPLDISVLI